MDWNVELKKKDVIGILQFSVRQPVQIFVIISLGTDHIWLMYHSPL